VTFVIRLAVALDKNRVVNAFRGGLEYAAQVPAGLSDELERLYVSDNVAVGSGSLSDRLATHEYRNLYVLTRNRAYHPPAGFESATPVRDFMDLVHRYADSDDELLVVGGPTLWRLFTPYARRVDVAESAEPVQGDVVYDEFEDGEFTLVRHEPWDGGRTLRYERIHLTAEPHPTW
jgi:hypothetical protein